MIRHQVLEDYDKCCSSDELMAKSIDEQARAYQFLEWKAKNIDLSKETQQYLCFLKELNKKLEPVTYMCGPRITAVDIIFAKSVYSKLEKENFGNVMRWYTQAQCKLDVEGKVVLAPMVRVSTHPMRLLALEYGADYVFCEEIVDYRLIRSTRIINHELNTVDFVMSDGSITFRTSFEERNKVFVQLGTPNAERAFKAAKMLENDVFGIDVNMGCPKSYSVKGGMGSALLTKPDQIREILTCLVQGLRIPVTCKIRILPKLEDTLALAKLIESTGVAALTVHGRTPFERPQHPVRTEVIRAIAESVSIPVLANGGSRDIIRNHDDIEYFRQQTNTSGVMIARAAMWNPAIFKNSSINCDEPVPTIEEMIKSYLTLAVRYDHHPAGAKYCVLQILHEHGDTPLYQDVLAVKELRELFVIWEILDIYEKEISVRCERLDRISKKLSSNSLPFSSSLITTMAIPSTSPPHSTDITTSESKRARLDIETSLTDGISENVVENVKQFDIVDSIPYERRFWPEHGTSPKQILSQYCMKSNFKPPIYQTIEKHELRLFFGIVQVEEKSYLNTSGCKSKKYAEQAAAIVCLKELGLSDGKIR